MKKNTAVSGTLILASAGFVTRLIGFIYRILISRLIGAQALGLFGLISPIYFFAFSLCGSGVYMAVSKLAAEAQSDRSAQAVVLPGLTITVLTSLAAVSALRLFAEPLGLYFLGDARTIPALRLLSLALPFCVAGNCFKAYFLGVRKMLVPAADQVLEQLIRMGVIWLLAASLCQDNLQGACTIAVLGNVAGDIVSCLFAMSAYCIVCRKTKSGVWRLPKHTWRRLLSLSAPLTVNRSVSSALSGLENIIIPKVLVRSGMSAASALASYGEFGGMAFPIILFPTLFTNALSTNLLPIVSSAKISGRYDRLGHAIEGALRVALYMGFFFGGLFLLTGDFLGQTLYNSPSAGNYICLLAFVCPFFYLQSILGGLMNGMDLQTDSLVHTVLCDGIRILILLLAVPVYGFHAFILSLILTNILLAVLNLHSLLRVTPVQLRFSRLLTPPTMQEFLAVLPSRKRRQGR